MGAKAELLEEDGERDGQVVLRANKQREVVYLNTKDPQFLMKLCRQTFDG